MGGKITENLEFESPLWNCQMKNFSPFWPKVQYQIWIMPMSVMSCINHLLYQIDMLNTNNFKNQKRLMPMISNINTYTNVNHFNDQKCQVSIMSIWIVLSINNSRYQCWQVSVLLWSIELSISCHSQKWQYHLCGDELCAQQINC